MAEVEKLTSPPTFAQIQKVHQIIHPFIHRTPIFSSTSLNRITGATIYFKCENFQKVGAFKMRGASSAVAVLSDDEKSKGIATHSSGNHAQAVALSAKVHGIPAHIVMPENAPSIKRAAVKEYEATIYTSGNRIEDREQRMEEVLTETGATFIHPYNNYNIIAGQATASKELIEDISDLEIIMAPVGGGGLMSGTALSTRFLLPSAKIYGVEPSLVDDAYRSFHSGQIENNDRIDTIADGLRTNLGDKTLAIIRRHVDDIFTVAEASIVQAMQLIWERLKIIVEPSGAVPLAAVLEKPSLFQGKKIGIILSGGNVDVHNLPF